MKHSPITRQRSPWAHAGSMPTMPGYSADTRWDEIAHARAQLLPADVAFVMHLPTEDQYVALHTSTFHLHEHPERQR